MAGFLLEDGGALLLEDGGALLLEEPLPPPPTLSGVYSPVPVVEIAFGFTHLDDPDTFDWIDVSEFVHEANTNRGEEQELSSPSAGTADVTLDNSARTFDPSYAAGPYFGMLLPDVPLRIRALLNPDESDEVESPVFYGYIEGWPLSYSDSGIKGEVTLTVSDALRVANETRLPNSVLEALILADSPQAYYRLGETTGARAVDASPNKADGEYMAYVARGATAITPYLGHSSINTKGRTDAVAVPDPYVGVLITDESARVGSDTTGDMTVEMWVAADDSAGAYPQRQDLITQGAAGSYGVGWRLNLFPAAYNLLLDTTNPAYAAGHLLVLALPNTPVVYYWQVPSVFDTLAHHIAIVVEVTAGVVSGPNPIGAANAYLDGQLLPIYATANAPLATPSNDLIIGTGAYVLENVSFRGRISDVALYRSSLSTSTIAARYAAGSSPYEGDTTGARAERILDLIGWPAALRSIDVGEMRVGPAILEGSSAGDYLLECQRAEQGRLFVSAAGLITFHNRGRFLSVDEEKTSQFDFAGADDMGLEDAISLALDKRQVFDSAVVAREGGVPIAVDTGTTNHTLSLTGLILADDRDCRQLAEYIVGRYSSPILRAEQWTMQPELNPSDWAELLALERGYLVGFTVTPGGIGDPIELALHLSRIAHRIKPEQWEIDFNGTPRDPNADSYFTWDGDGTTQGWGAGVWR